MTKRELIEFLNELVELAGEENRIRAAGMADRRLEEIQRLTAEREAGVICGS